MHLAELYRQSRPVLSIEIFPPKTPEGVQALEQRLIDFRAYAPDFISVTYGAGGSTRHNTHRMASYLKNQLGLEAMAHLTCVSHTRAEIDAVLDDLQAAHIENIMALRGDPPKGQTRFEKPKGGFAYASELITALKERGGFGIGAAGYPEGHIEASSFEVSQQYLLEKVRAGADVIVSQFFLENTSFLRWRDHSRKIGIEIPLVAGILPAQSTDQITRFAQLCGCYVPKDLMAALERFSDDPEGARQAGLDFAQRQIEELLPEGLEGVHLYALNRLEAVRQLAPLVKAVSPSVT